MFLTKKHLSRRTLLKGAGVSLALPLLDAMIPAATALAQTAATRKLRLGFFYLPHGAIMNNTKYGPQMDQWAPSGSGANFKLNVITQPLEPYKRYVTSFGNIKNDAPIDVAVGSGTRVDPHALRPATWLSAIRAKLPGPDMSATLDQVIAGRVGHETRIPSLQLSSELTVQQAAPNAAPYFTLSFRDATTPLPMEYNPRTVFLQLFGSEDRDEVQKQDASLLDLIQDQTRAMQRDLNASDRATLDSYLTQVREAEQKLAAQQASQQATRQALQGVKLPPIPKGVPDSFEERVNLMFDLIALAYRADLTRVVSFSMAMERTNQTYEHIGVRESFHPLSHHADQLDRISGLVKIQTWHLERFADFLGKLAAVPEGDGTLLDNAMFLYGSNMSNSDRHDTHPLPTLLIGGAAGTLAGGRHIELPAPTPISNLHLALLGKVGVEQKSFGDSTGAISL